MATQQLSRTGGWWSRLHETRPGRGPDLPSISWHDLVYNAYRRAGTEVLPVRVVTLKENIDQPFRFGNFSTPSSSRVCAGAVVGQPVVCPS